MIELTDNILKNNLDIIWKENDSHCYKLKLNEPSNVAFVFQFPNGDKVECPDCKSLQDFIDKLNRYVEVKAENTRLKEDIDVLKKNCEFNHKCLNTCRLKNNELLHLLKECSEYLNFCDFRKKTTKLLTKINEVLR